MSDFITVAHDGIDNHARVPVHLEEHYATRGWHRVDDEITAASDVQVVEPTDMEPAFIYGPDQDAPGDLDEPQTEQSAAPAPPPVEPAAPEPAPGDITTEPEEG